MDQMVKSVATPRWMLDPFKANGIAATIWGARMCGWVR